MIMSQFSECKTKPTDQMVSTATVQVFVQNFIQHCYQSLFPLILRANCMFFGVTVTRLACKAQRLESLRRETRKYSADSCNRNHVSHENIITNALKSCASKHFDQNFHYVGIVKRTAYSLRTGRILQEQPCRSAEARIYMIDHESFSRGVQHAIEEMADLPI